MNYKPTKPNLPRWLLESETKTFRLPLFWRWTFLYVWYARGRWIWPLECVLIDHKHGTRKIFFKHELQNTKEWYDID